MSLPVLSAIMVTGHKAERRRLALNAVECFRRQTFPARDRELLIINTGEPLNVPDQNIRELSVSQTPGITLGDLRNLAFDHATGEWLIQWDDDDWHHPERCKVQLDMRNPNREKCVLLKNQIRYDLTSGACKIHTCDGGIVGTILHHRRISWRYPSLRVAEDYHFSLHFIKRKIIHNRPELYCRFYHGSNTWPEHHIMGTAPPAHEMITPAQRLLLEGQILPNYR